MCIRDSLVDDDPVFVEALKAVLGGHFEILTAGSGEEAVTIMTERLPDILVLDVMMTYPSEGYDLAAALKKDPETAGIPIIMLTGVNRVFEIRSRLEKGWVDVEGFHTKPPDFDTLFESIDKHLHRPASVG